jgi:ppGpp synthetase/RelA/SpoT-type nucleotidyltranferase
MNADYGIRDEYLVRYPSLERIAAKLQPFIKEIVEGIERIDSVSARAKDPERYFQKAIKLDDNGKPKYTNARFEIQDQIGARITVFYLSDVMTIREKVVSQFRFIEEASKSPASESEFGYFGLHFILALPGDVVEEGQEEEAPEFFELQIKTLFQHAWSEAHHDLGYKSIRKLTVDERRKVAFTAAQAWGADTIFEELSQGLGLNDNEPSKPESEQSAPA